MRVCLLSSAGDLSFPQANIGILKFWSHSTQFNQQVLVNSILLYYKSKSGKNFFCGVKFVLKTFPGMVLIEARCIPNWEDERLLWRPDAFLIDCHLCEHAKGDGWLPPMYVCKAPVPTKSTSWKNSAAWILAASVSRFGRSAFSRERTRARGVGPMKDGNEMRPWMTRRYIAWCESVLWSLPAREQSHLSI